MNQREEIARVFAGMRRAGITPDAWLFVDGVTDWTWDESTIAGQPVYHSAFLRTMHEGRGDDCPWVMIFDGEKPNAAHLNMNFFRGYDEHQP